MFKNKLLKERNNNKKKDKQKKCEAYMYIKQIIWRIEAHNIVKK